MIQWLLSLPRKVLVTLVITVAIIFIILQDPPHTICRTQIDNFKSRQMGIIYKDPKIKNRKEPLMDVLINECKTYSSPGSCYGLFAKVRVFINDFSTVSQDCYENFSTLSEVRKTLFNIYDLMIRLAWGEAPSEVDYDKLNWLSIADVAVFCSVKESALDIYGETLLKEWETKVFQKLPGVETMDFNSAWEMSLVSENCNQYPR